jgi:hypothetical protein
MGLQREKKRKGIPWGGQFVKREEEKMRGWVCRGKKRMD